MCGLAAILATSTAPRPVEADRLTRIRDRMAARGPDGAGLWLSSDGRVGLAHRRLAIIDLSPAGAQPMVAEDGRLRIVFNGEIYNYRALRAELEQSGSRFRSHTDTEVILELYRRYGAEGFRRLRGMFAVVLWDEERRGLMLVRDPLGIKPLYVAEAEGQILAASQVKALLAGGGLDTSPDSAGHAGFFLWGSVPEPHTLYSSIRPLPAGSWLWVGEDGCREEGRLFDLQAEMAAAEGRVADGEALRGMLLDSVRHHLEADVPVGVFLSAGLDSTSIAALAAEVAGRPPATVTLGFSEFAGTANDEVPLAERAASHLGCDHVTRLIAAADFTAVRDQILEDMDQPSVDGVNTWLVARAARQRGLKVALSGLGGDELFGGYDSFIRVPRLVRRVGWAARMPGLGRLVRMVLAPWIGSLTSPKAAGILEYGGRISDAYFLRRALFMPWELSRVLDPELARDGLSRLNLRADLAEGVRDLKTPRLAVGALETGRYMRNQLLRDSDWAGMAHSLEIRLPLVDVELLRAVLPLVVGAAPPDKQVMAAAARPALPPEILNRPKTGFSVPVARWLGESSLRGWARTVHSAVGGLAPAARL